MITIPKPGRTKQELLESLEKLKTNLSKEISEYDIKLTPITDGYNVKGSKKIVFIEFSVDANIKAEDGKFTIDYTSENIPQGKLKEAMLQIEEVLNKV